MMAQPYAHQMMPMNYEHQMMPHHWGEECGCGRCTSKEQINSQYYEQIKQMEQGGANYMPKGYGCMPMGPSPYTN